MTDVCSLSLWYYIPVLMTSLVRKFDASLRVVPVREWSEDVFKIGLDLLDLPRVRAEMEIDLTIQKSLTGAFKTAHPGRICTPDAAIPTCFGQKICVKQVYWRNSKKSISRYRGPAELGKIVMEVNCLDWATILLDLTYRFIEEQVVGRGDPTEGIPRLRFVRAMLADVESDQKCFLIEEWVEGTGTFTKYINNGRPVSCVQADAPAEVHRIAEFLCFAQHVQYNLTYGLAFTSDYQGL